MASDHYYSRFSGRPCGGSGRSVSITSLRRGDPPRGAALRPHRLGSPRCYFMTLAVTSIFITSPVTGSVADVYCMVWPSRSSAVNDELKLRNDGTSGITPGAPPRFDASRPIDESVIVSEIWKSPAVASSPQAVQSMFVPRLR